VKWNRPEILCKRCGNPIPVGSHKKSYCSDVCTNAAKKERIVASIAKEKRDRMMKRYEKLKKELGVV
jgi:predicted nucleic acid-binding Zn ribbon protein